jgi:hypothetical protein
MIKMREEKAEPTFEINLPVKIPSILNNVSNSNSPRTLTFIPNVVSGICSYSDEIKEFNRVSGTMRD